MRSGPRSGKVLSISTSFPTLAKVPEVDGGEVETVDAGKTSTSVYWPDNWHQLSPYWRALLLREFVFKVISAVLQGDEKTFEAFKKLTGWGSKT